MSQIKVDFYILQTEGFPNSALLTCKLLEKAYAKKHQVFVFCDNQANADYLDELLWTYKDESFIPHNLQGEGPEPPPPIQIGFHTDENPKTFRDIMINLSTTIPTFHTQFKRIIEIVTQDESCKTIKREHYQTYKNNARYLLKTHQLT